MVLIVLAYAFFVMLEAIGMMNRHMIISYIIDASILKSFYEFENEYVYKPKWISKSRILMRAIPLPRPRMDVSVASE